jgi:hypothetical protein
VGKAVRAGSGDRGGRKYQLLAALLTYASIVSTYVPMAFQEMRQHKESASATAKAPAENAVKPAEAAPASASSATTGDDVDQTFMPDAPPIVRAVVALVAFTAIVLAAPILAGFSNIIGLLIIGFGVWEAWRLNKRLVVEVTGPHMIAALALPTAPAAGA